MTNHEIREEAKLKGVRLWEIAKRLGINDGNFSRRLRSEFSPEERERVLQIIGEIASEKEGQSNEQ